MSIKLTEKVKDAKLAIVRTSDGQSFTFTDGMVAKLVGSITYGKDGQMTGTFEIDNNGKVEHIIACNQIASISFEY